MAKADSKDHILQKTFFLLLTKGYDGVSITDIQRETGMSRGLLYHYYGGKDELFRVVVKKYLSDFFLLDVEQTKDCDVEEMIDCVVQSYRNAYRSWDECFGESEITIANYDFLIFQMIDKDKSIARLYADMREKEKTMWKDAVMRSIEKREIRNVLIADKIAIHIVALLDGLWLQAVERKNARQHIEQVKQVLMDYYELLRT